MIELAVGLSGASLLGVVIAIWMLWTVKRQIRGLGQNRPTVPTERLVAYWMRQLAKYEPGTPKHKAYKQRLAEYGDDGD